MKDDTKVTGGWMLFAVMMAFGGAWLGWAVADVMMDKYKPVAVTPEPEKIVVIGGMVSVDRHKILVEIPDSATGEVTIAMIEVNLVTKELNIKFDPDAKVSFMMNEKNKARKDQIAAAKAVSD